MPIHSPIKFLSITLAICATAASTCRVFDVQDFGAIGDGTTLDTQAINRAITAASDFGGGTVYVPTGEFLTGTIELQNNIELHLSPGATLIATDPLPPEQAGGYLPPEENEHNLYQDFGHTHWRNSLIWGDGLTNVTISGSGMIFGRGLSRGAGKATPFPLTMETKMPTGDNAIPPDPSIIPGPFGYPSPSDALPPGIGNKSIALKNCRNVTLKDFKILHGGHFGILATGVDNLTIDNLLIDTERDGIDIDACSNVRISNCSINSPFDDAICLKASYALGYNRATENVTISNCYVSGFDEGTLLDGTKQRSHKWPTGRIKFGTESNGGFRNITISNCVFEFSRGLALEQVDGGMLEDVTISNLVMRDIINAPIFIRLGERLRAPEDTPVGSVRRIRISNVVASNVANTAGELSLQGILLLGTPGHPLKDISLEGIHIEFLGNGERAEADKPVLELADSYPEPGNWGTLPSWGLFARHVDGLSLSDIELKTKERDLRHAIILDTVTKARLNKVYLSPQADGAAAPFDERKTTGTLLHNSESLFQR